MAQAKGANSQILIQEESVYNTAPSPVAMQRVHHVSCSLGKTQPFEEDNTIMAGRNPAAPDLGLIDVPGALVVNLQAYIGLLLKGLMGDPVTTGETAPYTHVFKIASALPSFRIEKGFSDIAQYFLYGGVKVSRMNMSISPNGPQAMTFDLVGASETCATSSADSDPTDLGYTKFSGRAISSILEGGSTIANVLSIDGFAIDNQLDTGAYALGGGGVRSGLEPGKVKVTGSLKAKFENRTLYDKAVAGTESSLKIIWTNGTGAGTAGNESLELLLPELIYQPQSPPIEGAGGILVTLPFQAFYNNASEASTAQFTLKNTTSVI